MILYPDLPCFNHSFSSLMEMDTATFMRLQQTQVDRMMLRAGGSG